MTDGKEESTARNQPAQAGEGAQPQLTCFVVTGFGNKTDYSTGRVLNLDKTYEQLIRPACDKVNVNCFRAIDANLTGSIDSIMYRWIYQADMVIADLSTLNANVFYELGVRHAQRPNTTIIIAESVLMKKIPFDLSSFVIHQYEHGGEEIGAKEQERFVNHLSEVLEKIIAAKQRRLKEVPQAKPESDSPVFTFLTEMTPPGYIASYLEPPVYILTEQRKKNAVKEGESLASVIDAAKAAKEDKNFAEAVRLFRRAIEMQTEGKPDKKPDVFLAQRLALVTYKEGEKREVDGNIDKQTAIAALNKAEEILATYCAPKISNDPETLGLSGAINKPLFELTDDLADLDRAIRFYERGFYVKRDYYNGINVAYMYTQRANRLLPDRFGAIVSYGHANMIRQYVAEICKELIDDEVGFASRGDKEWVYMTLAEAYQGLGRTGEEWLGRKIESEATKFGKASYLEQKAKLRAAMDEFERKVRLHEISATPVADGAPPATETVEAKSAGPLTTTQQLRPNVLSSITPISIDADIGRGKPIKSVEINCKIEYA